jgi:putative intracellular protease/amidase
LRHVAVLAYPGVDELDLAGVFTPLAKAAQSLHLATPFEVLVISPGLVTGRHGLRLEGQLDVRAVAPAALAALVLPGGPGAAAAGRDPQVARMIGAAVAAGVPTYAVCSGVTILGELGLLRGRRVGVHTAKASSTAAAYGCRPARGLIRDGGLVSAGGDPARLGLKAVEIAFAVLADLAPETIDEVAARLETGPRWREAVHDPAEVA